MQLDIIVNKYVLMWNLLYQTSVSSEMHELKQKIWSENKKKYSILHKEISSIMEDLDNYIPDDDEIFDLLESTSTYKKIKQDTNRYRLVILEIWDKNKDKYNKELQTILKYHFKEKYKICVVHPNLDIVTTDFRDNIITLGKKLTIKEKDNFLTYLVYKIIKNEFSRIKTDEKEIIDTVVELIATNELYTRVSGESKYFVGKKELRPIKEKIYPYFLMYLGVEKEMEQYMIRDNIFFNVSDYKYEPMLKSMDIFSFIKFIIKNKKYILKKKAMTVEDIEIL